MKSDITVRENILAELLVKNSIEVHIEDINELVGECISRCVDIKLEPHRTRRCWVIVSTIKNFKQSGIIT